MAAAWPSQPVVWRRWTTRPGGATRPSRVGLGEVADHDRGGRRAVRRWRTSPSSVCSRCGGGRADLGPAGLDLASSVWAGAVPLPAVPCSVWWWIVGGGRRAVRLAAVAAPWVWI